MERPIKVIFRSFLPLFVASPFVGIGSAKLYQELPLVALVKQVSHNPINPGFSLQSGLWEQK
jgi:hypothetical protein